MKYFFLFLMFPQIIFADVITDCGEYTARGIVREKPDGLKLIVNEKTLSEYVISMSLLEQGQLGGLINKDAIVQLILNKKFNGQKGVTSKIISAKSRILNPLNPEDTGLKLDKKSQCIE
ncbi:MAG: hypothetical protein H7336_05750 [Bacteriovorax sp.]|nr:hypothetical protein [Bacteriovorax sp.]